MATQRDTKPTVAPEEPPAPPYYIADQPLDIEHVRAFNQGDRVPVEHVERYGWAEMVHAPGADKPASDQQTKPETAEGQATTDRKGDA